MTGPEGNSLFYFSRISGILRLEGTKLTVSQGTSLKAICHIAGNFEAGNSLNLAVTAVVGQHSRVTVGCYLLTS